MQDLMPPVNTPDSLFHDGNDATGVEGTVLYAEFMNNEQGAVRDIQQEMKNVLADAGFTPDPAKHNQLLLAIQKLMGTAVGGVVRTVNGHGPNPVGEVTLTANDVGALRQIPLQSGSATHWLKIATMPPAVNNETRLEIELSGMSDYGINAAGMAVDRVYLTTRRTSVSTRVTAATVGNLIQQFSLGRSVDTQNYLVGVTEEVSNGNTTQYNFWLKMSNHTGISSTMNILNSRYSGVTIISDFSGANNSATEPTGIVYATRQQFFTTANPQQVADATTTAKGIVQLSSATNSASETLAATPKAVKATHDLAAAALPLTGGTVTGPTTFGGQLTVTNADFINKVGYTTYKDGDGHDHYQVGGLRLEVDGSQMAELYYNVLAGQSAEVSLHNKYGTTDSYLSLRNDGQLAIVGSWPAITMSTGTTWHPDGNIQGPCWEGDYLSNWLLTKVMPVGAALPWPQETPPPGWFLCNGSGFDRNACPRLAGVFPNGILPDYRGVFLRGKDSGKGIDPNRSLGDIQWGQAQLSAMSGYNNGSWQTHAQAHTGLFLNTGTDQSGSFEVLQESLTQRETRPTNISVNYIVRAA